ncbi:FTR1 family iron permease [Halomonas sp. V046]|uniref:FTR1 family iron permease n=1 Tax=Halomonas sp. V046 TaxID=3459611 RepID=UPI004043FB0D
MNEQAFFIVWRESVEAVLVVGIVYAWLVRSQRRDALGWLWLGVLGGVGVAGLLGLGMMGVGHWFQGNAQTLFQAVMALVAAALIVHMVMWMRGSGGAMTARLHDGLSQRMSRSECWGVAVLVGIAVAREGAETLVFLYGVGTAASQQGTLATFMLYAGAGLLAGLVSFALLQCGARFGTWRGFFRLTEVMLLCLASSLWVSAVERLITLGLLPTGPDPLWDTSAWLDDGIGVGGLLASFAGYRAWPCLTVVIAFALYVALIVWLLARGASARPRLTEAEATSS